MKSPIFIIRLSIFFAFLFSGNVLFAQGVKAVLVQLSSEQNRIQYFQKGHHPLEAVEIAIEAKKVRDAIIMDFTDHFDYCPVYYFLDTNREAIKDKHFEGILLDAKGAAVKNPVVNSSSSDYVVAYYGYSADNKSAAPDDKSLVVLNDIFQQIFVVFVSPMSQSINGQGSDAKYMYTSKKYDIGYAPHAEKLNDEMNRVNRKLERSKD